MKKGDTFYMLDCKHHIVELIENEMVVVKYYDRGRAGWRYRVMDKALISFGLCDANRLESK